MAPPESCVCHHNLHCTCNPDIQLACIVTHPLHAAVTTPHLVTGQACYDRPANCDRPSCEMWACPPARQAHPGSSWWPASGVRLCDLPHQVAALPLLVTA
jgi:hypothetical protein